MNIKKRFLPIPVLLLMILAGCATTGTIPVDIGPEEAYYISPANGDGVQDDVVLPLTVLPLERTSLSAYSVEIRDAGGNVVRSYEERVPRGGFFRRFRRNGVTVPETVLWAGDNDRGEYVEDGRYTLVVTVTDNRDNVGVGPEIVVFVDNTPPSAQVSTPFPLITPNNDGRLDTILIFQRESSLERTWTGEIIGEDGGSVRRYVWDGFTPDLVWDGTDETGATVQEGTYRYVLSATDVAGNSASFELPGIEVEYAPRPIALSASRLVFSPNGDGRADDITFTPTLSVTANVTSWTLKVTDRQGREVRSFTGDGLPQAIRFDGRRTNGSVLPDGSYGAILTVTYRGGQQPETAAPIFRIDTLPPSASVTPRYLLFSPDGDGRKDTIPFHQTSSVEPMWEGTVINNAGTVIRRWTWRGQAAGFEWDGRTTAGSVAPDDTYRYRLTATDEAQNILTVEIPGLRIDTRPTPVTASLAANRFSPNRDGVQDVITFNLGLSIPDGVEAWNLTVNSEDGRSSALIASGQSRVPSQVVWDGAIGGRTASDGNYTALFEATYTKGNVGIARSPAVTLDTTPPVVSVSAQPKPFSPDNDGVADRLTITLTARDAGSVESWRLRILDPTGVVFREFTGRGAPAQPIVWDGTSSSGELVQSAEEYRLVATATDTVWNTGQAEEIVPTDILVIRDGDRLRINITAIQFAPFTADYEVEVGAIQAARNRRTLDRLAEVLKKYPRYQISIEGHAVQIYWNNPARSAVEQSDVLLPLSQSRAEVVKEALIERGIPETRMTTHGYGGSVPIVPHGDLENRWKNRRVEFVLVQR